ncbi:MAG: putative transcriptional regulator [Clostridiaceae bacterium]|nr:putative transcriptional regulator [Clostridiaceae bacterium]
MIKIGKNNAQSEMNRGFLQILVLIILEEPAYGYLMARKIENYGYEVEEDTLYPLLRRLESKELISSKWETEDNKNKKYYLITDNGRTYRDKMLEIFIMQIDILKKVLGHL